MTGAHVRSIAFTIVASALFAGCQSYQPLPLDDSAHKREWLARDVNSQAVKDFARELAARDGTHRGAYNPQDGVDLQEAEVVALFFNASLKKARLDAGPPWPMRRTPAPGTIRNSISAPG